MPHAAHYDAIVIGTSYGGRLLPIAFAQAGQRVALIERGHLGGTCVNTGCTPTKTMVASAHVAYVARRGADYGVHTGPVSIDMLAVRRRKRGIVEGARSGFASRIAATQEVSAHGLDLLLGEAHFIGPKTLEVRLAGGEMRQITAPLIFLNVGGRPETLKIPGIERVPMLDSTSIMELDVAPEHLLIVGGGYIGLEFGQMFRRFGSRVTLVQHSPRLLMREDEDVSEGVAEILRGEGITLLTDATPLQMEPLGDGRIQLTVRTPEGGEQQLPGSHLLAAVGRVPNTEALTPGAAGIELDAEGYIRINEQLETSVPGVYALGDAKGGPAFTHVAYDDVRILRANLLGQGGEGGASLLGQGGEGGASMQERLVPYTIFIDPQLARVGLSEAEASRLGRDVRVAKLPMSAVPRAIETGETRGFMKAVVDAETRQILGGVVLGAEGGELMAILQVAMLGRLPYTALRDAIFTHPTLAEGLNGLFATLDS